MIDDATQDDTIHTPVQFTVNEDDMVTLKFGPLPFDDLIATLLNLGTEDGNRNFLLQLEAALRKVANK